MQEANGSPRWIRATLPAAARTCFPMRRALDLLYNLSGFLAGLFLVGVAALTFLRIVGRLLGFPAESYDDFAGYSMAASSFLGLAWTLRSGGHIRVDLLLRRLKGSYRWVMEGACLVTSCFLTMYFAWHAVDMALTSYQLSEVSQGLVPVPLWIPQSGMALGLVVLAIAFADDLIVLLSGGNPSYETGESVEQGSSPLIER